MQPYRRTHYPACRRTGNFPHHDPFWSLARRRPGCYSAGPYELRSGVQQIATQRRILLAAVRAMTVWHDLFGSRPGDGATVPAPCDLRPCSRVVSASCDLTGIPACRLVGQCLKPPVAEVQAWVGIGSGQTRLCGGGRLVGLGPGRRRRLPEAGVARIMMAAGAFGAGRSEARGPLERSLVVRAQNDRAARRHPVGVWPDLRARVLTALAPRGTDLGGAKLTAGVVLVLTGRVGPFWGY